MVFAGGQPNPAWVVWASLGRGLAHRSPLLLAKRNSLWPDADVDIILLRVRWLTWLHNRGGAGWLDAKFADGDASEPTCI